MKKKILIIAGPTATGKTALAVKLAKEFDGEIVSADSRQVYRGMDIITGKDRPAGLRIWLYDVVEPNEKFSVADYCQLAWKTIDDIWKRGKLPIIVGGTGFYLSALLNGLETMGIGPDWELRERLSHCSIDSLSKQLKEIAPEKWKSMNESDRNNPRRLIRAIEVALGRKNQELRIKNQKPELDKLFIGLTASFNVLYQRIDERVEERIKMGAEEEVRKLIEKGYRWDNSVLGTTIGYQEWRDFFEGKATKKEAVQKWKFDEHSYARRQMTWFKKVSPVSWIDIEEENWNEKVAKMVEAWYIKLCPKK